jgi:hypothetical protein
MMSQEGKSKLFTTWVKNSMIVSRDTQQLKGCVVPWFGVRKDSCSICYTTQPGWFQN